MGRCGRLAEGVCIRLFDESDFLQRPAFADPEIHRSSLAAVMLCPSLLHWPVLWLRLPGKHPRGVRVN